jgi:hypothetical protein
MEFDWISYFQATIAGVPLLFLVYGLVTLYGRLGLHGTQQLLSSLGTGLILGVFTMVAQVRPPTGDWWEIYVYWFGNIAYGLGLGLATTLYYDSQKQTVAKAINTLESQAVMGAHIEEGPR